MPITFEDAFCYHCAEPIFNSNTEDITIRDSHVYHDECLPENLKDSEED